MTTTYQDASPVTSEAVAAGITDISVSDLDFTPAYLTGASDALSTIVTWNAVTDGSFSIMLDGIARVISSLNFVTDTTMYQVALRLQMAIRAVTLSTESVQWVINHFVLTSGSTDNSSAISVTSSSGSGTDISGAATTPRYMSCNTAKGIVSARSYGTYTLNPEDSILRAICTATDPVWILLPRCVTAGDGKAYIIKDSGYGCATHNITIVHNGSEKIGNAVMDLVMNTNGANTTLRCNLGTSNWEPDYGSMAQQSASGVAITGGSITGTNISGGGGGVSVTLSPTGQTSRAWRKIIVDASDNVYALDATTGYVYKRNPGSGVFQQWSNSAVAGACGMVLASSGNWYVGGSFLGLSADPTTGLWADEGSGLAGWTSGCSIGTNIYWEQNNAHVRRRGSETGVFADLGQSQNAVWLGMCAVGADVYASINNQAQSGQYGIWKLTKQTGIFAQWDTSAKAYRDLVYFNGMLYAVVYGVGIFKTALSPVNWVSCGQAALNYESLCFTSTGVAYVTVDGGDILKALPGL